MISYEELVARKKRQPAMNVTAVQVLRKYVAGLERNKVLLPGAGDKVLRLALDRVGSRPEVSLANVERLLAGETFVYRNPEAEPVDPVPLRASLRYFGVGADRAQSLYAKYCVEFAERQSSPAAFAREILIQECDEASLGSGEPGLSADPSPDPSADPMRTAPAARLRELGVGGF